VNPKQSDQPIRILLLDQSSLFRATLARFLRSHHDFEVTAECAGPSEAVQLLANSGTTMVLANLEAYSTEDGQFISDARQAGYQGRFLAIAEALDARPLALALKHGVSGIVVQSDELTGLVGAIRRVASDEMWVDRQVILAIVNRLADRFDGAPRPQPDQTREDREQTVMRGILSGLSNGKIADGMGLSESSVKYIVQRLFNKAGVKTRSQLVRVAVESSLETERARHQMAGSVLGSQSNA
jgi:two-component system, NarL family, nitrate/nitrite response regulator NarL